MKWGTGIAFAPKEDSWLVKGAWLILRTLILSLLVAPLEVLPPASKVLLFLDSLAVDRLQGRLGGSCTGVGSGWTTACHA